MPLIQWETDAEQAHIHLAGTDIRKGQPVYINDNGLVLPLQAGEVHIQSKVKIEYSIEYDDAGNPFIVEEELPEETEDTYDYTSDDFNYDQSQG